MTSSTIPGWLGSDVIDRSGLTGDAVRAAIGDTTNPDRCKVEIALLNAALANQDRVSEEMLRGL